MDTKSRSKKVCRKQKKLQHVVTKETGVVSSESPSKILAICNAGLVSGLSEEIVVKYFTKYGILDNIMLIPGKSCSFLKYRDLNSSIEAFANYNGKLNIAQDNKPIYLSYIENLPNILQQEKNWNLPPPGLFVLENFITELEEANLLKLCKFDANSGQMKHRNVAHFGYEFRYDINNVDKDKPLLENIPGECDFLWQRLQDKDLLRFKKFVPDQLTVNHYLPGQGIPNHVDTHSAFEDPIMSLSLQSSIVMEFKGEKQHSCVVLPRRSLAIMSGECRYDWTHGITPRKFDVVFSENGFTSVERNTRISFTFRKVLQGECCCNFPRLCDSFNKKEVDKVFIEDKTAAELENLHVHEVYENIASHFSETRHKPWPNVLDFVQSFAAGEVLVDIGCGNGKYLGHNKNICELGCDRSFGLIDVCKTRGFEAFTGNCLNVPLKNNIADGAISIAVIHHLANDDRRFRAIQEMVRVLRVGGKALIYVWAKDQHKNKQKSSYIKQDRKNRKGSNETASNCNEEITTSINKVTLPVHTNRTQFKHRDVLVPWKLKDGAEENTNTFLRFYHVFEEFELENLCKKIVNVEIVKSYYDQGNWCVIIQKK